MKYNKMAVNRECRNEGCSPSFVRVEVFSSAGHRLSVDRQTKSEVEEEI